MRMLQSGSDLIIALVEETSLVENPGRVHISMSDVSEDQSLLPLKSSPLRHPDRHGEMAEEFPSALLEPVNRRYSPSLVLING